MGVCRGGGWHVSAVATMTVGHLPGTDFYLSRAHGLMFTAGENARPVVVTMFKKSVL